jgi:ABC-type multidrug transport system fused ATPase/permease subunit
MNIKLMYRLNNLLYLLEPSAKKKFVIIIFFNFVVSLSELMGVAAIYPLLLFIINGDSNNFLFISFQILNPGISNNYAFFFIIALSLFLIKNIFSIYVHYLIQSFLFHNYNFMTAASLKKMLSLSYLDFLDINSSNFIRNTKELVHSIRQYMMAFIFFLSEIILITCLLSFLFFISIKLTLISSISLTFIYFLFSLFLKKKLTNVGKERNEIYSKLTAALIEMYNSFRELKIYSNYQFYIDDLNTKNSLYALTQFNTEFITNITRNLFEILVVIIILFLFVIFNFDLDKSILPKLAIVFFIFFRLYPSFTKLSYLNSTMKTNEDSLNIYKKILNKNSQELIGDLNTKDNFKFDNEIKINSIFFKYPNSEVNTLNNVNFIIKKGEIIGIAGENGSGKTTLCNIILSLINPTSGNILVDQKYDIKNFLNNYRKILSFIPQNIFLYNDTIVNNITFNEKTSLINHKKLQEVLKSTKLQNLESKLKNNNYFIGENGNLLSGGQRQRVAIARSLYRDSELIILDEHTSALDLETEHELMQDLINLFNKKTVIVISHRVEVLKFCNKIYNLKDGILSVSNN